MSETIPKTCRAVVIDAPGSGWALRDVEVKQPERGQVLIKSLACGVCHSDCLVQQGAFGPDIYPRVPGHEVIGRIVAVGEGETKWKVGDKVGGPWHGGHDGTCKACNRGLFQVCANGTVNGVFRDGGFSEYVLLRSEATVRIPPDADPAEYAPLLCAGVTVFNSIRRMNIVPGDTVAIQGLGGLGHLAIQYARKMGYRTVAISTSSAKKDFATELGATDFVETSKDNPSPAEALQKMGGASLIIVTAPNPQIMGPLVDGLGPLGKLLILAPVGEIPVNTVPLIMGGRSVHGWPSGHALDSEEAIDFAEKQGVKCMIEKFKLDDVATAIKHMEDGKVRFRGVLVFD